MMNNREMVGVFGTIDRAIDKQIGRLGQRVSDTLESLGFGPSGQQLREQEHVQDVLEAGQVLEEINRFLSDSEEAQKALRQLKQSDESLLIASGPAERSNEFSYAQWSEVRLTGNGLAVYHLLPEDPIAIEEDGSYRLTRSERGYRLGLKEAMNVGLTLEQVKDAVNNYNEKI